MMECDEIIEHIDAAEYGIEAFATLRGHKIKTASALSIAAFAFAQMASERSKDLSVMDEFAELIRLVLWVEELRKGHDPRCNLCRANGTLKRDVVHYSESEVVQ